MPNASIPKKKKRVMLKLICQRLSIAEPTMLAKVSIAAANTAQ